MAHFCAHCGAQHDGQHAYCASCGQPLPQTAPSPAAPPPPPSSPPAAPPPTGHYPPQPGYPPQPRSPRPNPFVGWPLADYVRDGAALFCLFAALGMPWQIELDDKGGEQWWVVISVLLSAASIVVPYLAKARVVPGWGGTHYRLLKLALNLPFLASVLAVLVNELINVGEDVEGGIGVGVAMGLAGCALAVQPRQADEEPGHADDRLWSSLARWAALAVPVVAVLMFVGYVLDDLADESVLFDEPLGFVVLLLSSLVMTLVVVGWPAAGLFTGSPAWRRVFITAGFTVLVVGLFSLASDGDGLFFWPPFEKWNGALGIGGTFVLGAAAGLAASRAEERRTSGAVAPLDGWLRTARSALLASTAGSAVTAVILLVGLINAEEAESATIVGLVVVALVTAAGGVATALSSDVARRRVVLLGVLAAQIVLGLIAMGVLNNDDVFLGPVGLPELSGFGTWLSFWITGYVAAAWVTLPALAAYALVAPREVRAAFGPLIDPNRSGQPPAYPGGYPPQQPPYQQHYPQPGHPPAGPPPPQQNR